MRKFSFFVVLIGCLTLTALAGCRKSLEQHDFGAPANATDYSRAAHWSIQANDITHPIDVFFVHPTTYGPPSNGKYNADLDDAELNARTDREAVNWMTDAFSGCCNVFAPRYRQMNIEVLSMSEARKAHYMEAAINDVQAAFAYYLKHLNNGRPYILAGHSQGSNALLEVLLRHPDMLERSKLVAAYMPGWTFTSKNLRDMGLELSRRPDRTGALITWNTVGPDGVSPVVREGAVCVNPLSWTTDSKQYPASRNRGARILLNDGKALEVDHFTAAHIADRNGQRVLEIPTPEPEILKQLNMSMGPEVYHRYDYDFFFNNIRENVKVRCEAYLQGR